MFEFYNPNPHGRRVGDCVVRAVSKALDQDWQTTYLDLIEHSRGTYVVGTGTHAIAVVDGCYYDAWDSGNEIVLYYWKRKGD